MLYETFQLWKVVKSIHAFSSRFKISYTRFLVIIVVSRVVMSGSMYPNTYAWDHVFQRSVLF